MDVSKEKYHQSCSLLCARSIKDYSFSYHERYVTIKDGFSLCERVTLAERISKQTMFLFPTVLLFCLCSNYAIKMSLVH